MKSIGFILLIGMIAGCNSGSPEPGDKKPSIQVAEKPLARGNNRLGEYWYQGEAEVNRYEVSQNRYKDLHPGEAVLIFVTEDFLTDKQVKNDYYRNPNSVSVLKTNLLLRFPTGIYDYSMMTSVFTPVNSAAFPQTLKVTNSSQDWCGQTFLQANLEGDQYRVVLHSYFEGEADSQTDIPAVILEDELFNRIRIHPEGLPTGRIPVIPSAVVARLTHSGFEPLEALASLDTYSGNDFEGAGLKVYRLQYPSANRILEIVFEKEPPYRITGWTDSYPSAFDRQVRKTIARRTHMLKTAYWKQNGLQDMALRQELGLNPTGR